MAIERVTVTIKKDLLKRIDDSVDGKMVRNRSHAIENMLLKALHKVDLDTVMILAGGEGAKLRPITYEIPKAMIPIRGRPILEHQINMLKKYDIRNIILSVGEMHEKIRDYFGDGSKFGVNLHYVVEERPLGSAGPIAMMKDFTSKTFAVLNVDTLMNPDIAGMFEFHKSQGKLGTLLLSSTYHPEAFGVVRVSGNTITEFIEKPKSKVQSPLISSGFYVFEPSITGHIPRNKFMIGELFKKLAEEEKLAGFLHDGYTYDVGTHEGYEKAIKEWKGGKQAF